MVHKPKWATSAEQEFRRLEGHGDDCSRSAFVRFEH